MKFEVCGDDCEILESPTHFYDRLLNLIDCSSSRRITLSALYLGASSSVEREIWLRLENQLATNANLRLTCLFDAFRTMRKDCDIFTSLNGVAKACGSSTTANDRVNFSVYQTPGYFVANFVSPRWREISGVQHMKLFIFDDTVLISGANLSTTYFTNRQDRYLVIKNSPQLANYCQSLIDHFSGLCQKFDFSSESFKFPGGVPRPDINAKSYSSFAQKSLENFFETASKLHHKIPPGNSSLDTSIQCHMHAFHCGIVNQFGEAFIRSALRSDHELTVSSGYLNLTPSLISALNSQRSKAGPTSILFPSILCNGFFNATTWSGAIPLGYYRIAVDIAKRIKRKHANLFEYERSDWSYHAKGMWSFPAKSASSSTETLTLIGSSNFGYRSHLRDVEFNMTLSTRNASLVAALMKERNDILAHSKPFVSKRTPPVVVPTWAKLVVKFCRKLF